MEPDMPARTHPIEGARGRDAGGAPPEVLDEVVHTDVLVLHVRFGPNLSAAPRSEDTQEPGPDVGGRDQAERPQIQAVVGGRRGGGDARAAGAVANRGEVVARRLADTGIHGGAVRRGLRLQASIHVASVNL